MPLFLARPSFLGSRASPRGSTHPQLGGQPQAPSPQVWRVGNLNDRRLPPPGHAPGLYRRRRLRPSVPDSCKTQRE